LTTAGGAYFTLGAKRPWIMAELKKAGATAIHDRSSVIEAKLGTAVLRLVFLKKDTVQSVQLGGGQIYFRGTKADLGQREEMRKLFQTKWSCGKPETPEGGSLYHCGAGVSFTVGARTFPVQVRIEPTAENPKSCLEALGEKQAKVLVDQCRQLAPKTNPPTHHPQCNPSHDCGVMQSVIFTGCAMYSKDEQKEKPKFCPR
jgi:hypothetical protein